jgi:hypothetical protein
MTAAQTTGVYLVVSSWDDFHHCRAALGGVFATYAEAAAFARARLSAEWKERFEFETHTPPMPADWKDAHYTIARKVADDEGADCRPGGLDILFIPSADLPNLTNLKG